MINDDFVRSSQKTTAGMMKKIPETLLNIDDTYESRKVKRKLVIEAFDDEASSKKTKGKKRNDKVEKRPKDREIGIKGKKKMSKKEDEIVKIRNSPKILSEMISSLSQEQQKWVRNAGFGSLLHFDLGKLPQRLAFKVLEAFDDASCMLKLQNGNIKITEREVYDVLGLPCEGDEVVITQGDARHERIIQWRAQFPISDGQNLIKASEVLNRMKQERHADELFKMNFLIIITNVLIRSHTNNFVSQMILSFDAELDNCAQYNWAAYLIKNLVITKERWMWTTSLFYTGPMIFLIILYVDRVLYKGHKLVSREKPAFRGWTKEKLRERESMESEPDAFGSGAIFETTSAEEVCEYKRIKEDEDWLERLNVKATLLMDAKTHYDSELANAKNMHPKNKKILEVESKIRNLFQTSSHDQQMDNEHFVENENNSRAATEEDQVGGDAKMGAVDINSKYKTRKYAVWRWVIQAQKDQFSDSFEESGYLESLPRFNPESDFGPATQNVYSRRQYKDQSEIFSLRSDATPIESDIQKEANVSQEASHVITKTVQPLSSNESSTSYSQAPRSVSAEMVEFFKQSEEQIQENKFDVYRVLPPQIQLDEEIIQDYQKVLKKYLSGRLLDLANDSNFQDFNKVLHFLMACRRIPSHLQQGFLTLRWDLPNLTSRAYELHKEVKRGMVVPLASSKEREELRCILGKYRQVEDNMLNLEKEKDANLLVIARLQMRNERLNEEVTDLKAEAVNVVGGCGKLCNDEMEKLEQIKDHISDEIVRLQAINKAIDAKIIKFADKVKVLHKDASTQHYKVINLEAMGAVYEANVENAMNRLVTMELKWKERVELLDY